MPMSTSLFENVKDLQAAGLSRRKACDRLGVSESTMRLWESRGGPPAEDRPEPGIQEHTADVLTITTDPAKPPAAGSWTPETLLRDHGLDPAEWSIVRVRGNRWGAPEGPNHQLRIDVIPTASTIAAASSEDWEPLPQPTAPEHGERSVVYCTDHHAPHVDEDLHAAFCSYLSDTAPDLLVIGGDAGDFASVSRHRDTLGFAQGLKECNRGVYSFLRDYREASMRTRIVMLPGNHDARLEHYIADRADALTGVAPAFDEDIPAYSFRRLWRLDELGVELIPGDWERAKFAICRSLTARHGYMVADSTPQKMLAKHGRSQIQGHSHRLRFTYRTKHDPIDVRVAIEAGCMCKIEEGLGYAAEPDWQQGFVAGHIWDDGDFALAPHPYISGKLLCPDGRRFFLDKTPTHL